MPSSSQKVIKDPLTGVRAPTPRKTTRTSALTNGSTNGKSKRLSPKKLVEARRGIILDIGCGDEESKYPGAVGMDRQDLPGVDVVHNWNSFPWPFETGSVLTIIASHVVEHVNPADGHFIDWMNEAWRCLRVGGQMAIVTPYAGSDFYWQDPTHLNGCTERTWWYFAEHPSQYRQFYRPKPWFLEQNNFSVEGMLETVLRKLEDHPKYYEFRAIPKSGVGA